MGVVDFPVVAGDRVCFEKDVLSVCETETIFVDFMKSKLQPEEVEGKEWDREKRYT